MLVTSGMSQAYATVEYALQGGASWYHFNNPFLFGQRDSRNISDQAWSSDIGAAVFIPMPTQRSFLLLNGKASKLRYGSQTQLEHVQKQWEGLYQWEFDSILRGKFSHRDDVRLFNYYDGLRDGRRWPENPDPNNPIYPTPGPSLTDLELPHLRQTQAEIALRISPRFDVPVTFTRESLRFRHEYDITPYSLNSRSQQIAIRYESGTKSTLSAGVKRTAVDYPQRTEYEQFRYDSGYRDKEIFLDTAWRYTENTILLAWLGSINRQFNTQHHERLTSTEIGADWHYSVKTWFTLRLWNRPESINESGDKLYSQVRGAQVRMIWDATYKTSFQFLTSIEQERYRTFNNNITSINAAVSQDNKLLRFGVVMNYNISPKLTLRLETTRRQEISGNDKHNNTVFRANIRYSFENLTGNNRARIKLDAMK